MIVIGSQAVLGQFPEASGLLTRSMEADMYPRSHPELADEVDGAIGEGSRFHETHGYYAQGVGPDTANASKELAKAPRTRRESEYRRCRGPLP